MCVLFSEEGTQRQRRAITFVGKETPVARFGSGRGGSKEKDLFVHINCKTAGKVVGQPWWMEALEDLAKAFSAVYWDWFTRSAVCFLLQQGKRGAKLFGVTKAPERTKHQLQQGPHL